MREWVKQTKNNIAMKTGGKRLTPSNGKAARKRCEDGALVDDEQLPGIVAVGMSKIAGGVVRDQVGERMAGDCR